MLGSLGGGGTPSVNQASPMNIAGLLQYCVKNNYLSGGSATSVKDLLVNKVTGSGEKHLRQRLSGGQRGYAGKRQRAERQPGGRRHQGADHPEGCDQVLQYGKSLL